MTSIYDDAGNNVACTVVEAGPCVVTQVKTDETDGYNALQLGFGDAKVKNTSKPLLGHFDKARTAPKKRVVEFRDFDIIEKAKIKHKFIDNLAVKALKNQLKNGVLAPTDCTKSSSKISTLE